MEYDANALRAAGMSEEAIAQVLGFNLADYQAQYKKAQADQAAALAAAQATGMSDQYTQLYGGADIVPGTTQGILSNLGIENPYLPVYSLIGSASVGNDLANERMQFAPIPGVSYRLVDKTTGETTTANTPEEIKALIEQSNALSAAGGKGANLAIESNQSGSWSPVFTDEPNPLMDTITKIALAGIIASTGAGLLQPGGLGGVGAAGTTGATGAGAAGAGTAAGAAGLAPAATVAAAAPVAAAASSDLVITALMAKGFTAAQAAALVATGGAAAALASSAGTTAGATPATNAANTMPPATTTGPDLLLTAQQTGSVVPAVVPAAVAGTIAAVTPAAPAATSTTPAPNPAEDLTLTAPAQPQPVIPTPVLLPPTTTTPNVPAPDPAEDIKVTAPKDTQVVTPPAIPPVFLPPTTTPPATTPTDTTPPAKKDDFLGTGLSLTQLATLLGLSVEAVKALFGGGGSGTTPTTPYVSPFGAMGSGFGAGVDYRVNPNIIDYERYGFGPEASFFRPEYSGLVSRAAGFTPSTTQTASGGGTANPVYQPLIGPSNPAAYQQGGPNPDALKPGDIMTRGLENVFSQYGSANQPMIAPGGNSDFYNQQIQRQRMFEAANPGFVITNDMTSDEYAKYIQARDAFDRNAAQVTSNVSQAPSGATNVARGLIG